jgi:hypothetical protein
VSAQSKACSRAIAMNHCHDMLVVAGTRRVSSGSLGDDLGLFYAHNAYDRHTACHVQQGGSSIGCSGGSSYRQLQYSIAPGISQPLTMGHLQHANQALPLIGQLLSKLVQSKIQDSTTCQCRMHINSCACQGTQPFCAHPTLPPLPYLCSQRPALATAPCTPETSKTPLRVDRLP